MKNTKGITLIALVITIIVLLILAGVSISMVTGDNGIASKATEAKERTKLATSEEEGKLENTEKYIDDTLAGAAGFTVVFLLAVGGAVYATKTNLSKVSFPETPTKSGHDFTGWYYDEACTNEAKEGDAITANTTLYAGWEQVISNSVTSRYNNSIVIGMGTEVANFVTSKNVSSCEIEVLEDVFAGTSNQIDSEDFDITISSSKTTVSVSLPTYPQEATTNAAKAKIKITYEDGSCDYEEFNISIENICMAEGTKIKLADGTNKNIEDITYDDELLVWDFDNGVLASSKPLWIKKEETTNKYNLLKFENGSELKTISQHRIFNKEAGKFTYPMTEETPVGTTTITSDGTETKLASKEVIEETVKFYNVITDYHMNLFAENILTSCRLSNLYEIKDMKYVKDNRELASKEEYSNIPEDYFKGLRIAEQPKEVNRGNDNKFENTLEEYVQRLIAFKK